MNQKKECMDVHVNGLKFHVQTFGSGVPIIMIMGGTESSGQSSESDFDKYICKCKSGI